MRPAQGSSEILTLLTLVDFLLASIILETIKHNYLEKSSAFAHTCSQGIFRTVR